MVFIAIDTMGGDGGSEVVLDSLELIYKRLRGVEFNLFGDQEVLNGLLECRPHLKKVCKVFHTTVAIGMDEKPSKALRRGYKVSSMWQALQSVADGHSSVCVSAGNTGALMAMSRLSLRMIKGIDRPALAAVWPTMRGECVVLDVGASTGALSKQLVDFAMLGAAISRVLFDKDNPRTALLNVGVEDIKGLESIKEAGNILKTAHLEGIKYCGFVEASDICRGEVDVIVSEGFAGNMALKSAEGTARLIGSWMKGSIQRTWRGKLAYLVGRPVFEALRYALDPNNINGGVMLGLNGLVVKSHGGVNARGFSSAVKLAYDLAKGKLQSRLESDILSQKKSLEAIKQDSKQNKNNIHNYN